MNQFLLGKFDKKAEGAIILSDGESWVHRLHVDIDVDVNSAFDVEMISILIANEIAVVLGARW